MATNKRARTGKTPRRRRLVPRWLWRPVAWMLRRVALVAVALAALCLLWVLAYRVIDPPGGLYMAAEYWRLGALKREWRDLEGIGPDFARAAMAAEDARFCAHWGFDLDAIGAALEENAKGGRVVGASTISQQVAKNVFLWPARSWVRKGVEAGVTVLIEATWPKRRILEVYLNIAEFDEGVFGAEAAARHHFGRRAGELSLAQAATLAAVLPNPKGRSAVNPGSFTRSRARAIAEGARTLQATGADACLALG